MPEPIHIAMAADTDFTVPLCLAIHSMLQHAAEGTHYRFHLLDSGINQKLLERTGADYVCYDVRHQLRALPCGGRFPYTVYHRFLLPELLPAGLDRVLYLDCDIMVREDLSGLYHMPLGGNPIAAAPWVVFGSYKEEFGAVLKSFPSRFHLPEDDVPYFYSSMLLMDLRRMREEGTARQLIHCAETAPQEALLWPDQDVINAVLHGRITPIPLRYNVIPLFLPTLAQETEEAQTAFATPAIIHFAARKPNILTGPRDEPEKEFFALWNNSPWRRHLPYPLVSLRNMPGWMAALLLLPVRTLIRCPRLLRVYGKVLAGLRGH